VHVNNTTAFEEKNIQWNGVILAFMTNTLSDSMFSALDILTLYTYYTKHCSPHLFCVYGRHSFNVNNIGQPSGKQRLHHRRLHLPVWI